MTAPNPINKNLALHQKLLNETGFAAFIILGKMLIYGYTFHISPDNNEPDKTLWIHDSLNCYFSCTS